MKNKIIFVVIFLIIAGTVSFAIYFANRNKPAVNTGGNLIENQNNIPENSVEGSAKNQVPDKNKIVTEDFSITLPLGWSKTIDSAPGTVAMAANPNEDISDPTAKKINFKSYLAISPDTLQGKTLNEYTQSVKTELQNVVSGTAFSNEKDLMINGGSARAVEAEMTQQGVNFKVLIVIIQGNGESVWVLSYNTAKSSWDGYKEAFAESVMSFVLNK